MGNRTRNVHLHFDVTPEEKSLIVERARNANYKNMNTYLLKMALTGFILKLDLESITEMNRLLANATNNINQIARQVNITGRIYTKDIEQIRQQQKLIAEQNGEILKHLSKI